MGCSSSGSLNNHHNKRTHIDSQGSELVVNTGSAHGGESMHELILGSGTSFKQQGQEPVSLLSVQLGPPLIQKMGLQPEVQRLLGIRLSWTQIIMESVDDSNLDTASTDCVSCSDTDEVYIRTANKKYRKRVQAPVD